MPTLLAAALSLAALPQADAAPQACGFDATPFTVTCPNPTSQVTKAWGGRVYTGFHRRLGTPPNHTDYLWAGEDGGRISRSTDDGQTWTNQNVPDDIRGEVRGMYVLADAVTGWAVTSDGWVIKTTDAGGCWERFAHFTNASGEGAELFDVFFFGPLRGFVAGEHVLKSTVDGGASWQDQAVDAAFDVCTGEIYALDVAGSVTTFMAVAATEPGPILYRTQSNSEWEIAYAPVDPCSIPGSPLETWDIDLAPGSTATDGVAYAVAGEGNGCGSIYRGVYHVGSIPIWTWTQEFHECVGAPSCPRTTPLTTDVFGCSTNGAGYANFSALYMCESIDQDLAIAVGYGAGVFYRDAATSKWIDISDRQYFSTAPLGAVVASGFGNAWLFGEFGDRRILDLSLLAPFQADTVPQSPPPVRPYSALTPQTPWRLRELWFSGATTGWGVGQLGRIVRWDELNSTWVQARGDCVSTPSAFLNSIVFGSTINGIAVGERIGAAGLPQMYMTRTGGQSSSDWSPMHTLLSLPPGSTSPQDLYDVAHRPGTSPPEYWAVGNQGFAIKMYRVGSTWTLADASLSGLPALSSLTAIEFVDAATAVVVGGTAAAGKAWKLDVSSGSASWTALTLPSVTLLNDVATVGSKVWAVGLGTVLYNADFTSSPSNFSHLAAAEAEAGGADLVAIDAVMGSTNPEVMIGGLDGVLVYSSNSTTFDALDSETAKHIKGVSMPVAGKAWMMGTTVKFENNDTITLRYD